MDEEKVDYRYGLNEDDIKINKSMVNWPYIPEKQSSRLSA
jgi:hypothetical protein